MTWLMWLAIGVLVVIGVLFAVVYVSLATFFGVNARALEEQAERESIPTTKAKKKKSVSVGV